VYLPEAASVLRSVVLELLRADGRRSPPAALDTCCSLIAILWGLASTASTATFVCDVTQEKFRPSHCTHARCLIHTVSALSLDGA
jgi:hypothetical protein